MPRFSRSTQFLIVGGLFAATLHSQSVQAIQNGTNVQPAEILEKGLVDVGGNCSGVLIANDWALTAGHCVIRNQLQPQNIVVTFNGASIQADALYLFGGYTDEVGPDLGLLHLSGPFQINGAPTGYITPIWHGDPSKLVGKTVASYGQGHNACPLAGFGTYRAADFVVGGENDAIGQPNDPALPPNSGNFTTPVFGHFYNTPKALDAAGNMRTHLPGDSGGPHFIFENGVRQLVGIHSGSDGCASSPVSYHNHISRLRPWIADVLKSRWSAAVQSQPVFVFPNEVAGTKWGFSDVNTVHWAQAARAAAAMCYNRGFAAGHFDGHQGPFGNLGSGFGTQCSRGDTLWRDVTTAQMDPVWRFAGDINQVNWAVAGRAAERLCAALGYAGGQFNGHQRDGRYGLFCYRGGAQWFDATDPELAATGFGFPTPRLDDNLWAQAARAAVGFCRAKGFSGGFMNGHQVPGRYGVVCQR